MNFTEHNITLDLHQIGSQVFLPMFRGDCKRKIVIHLVEDGRPYDFDAGLKAHFTGAKPDGTFLYNDCEVNEKNSTIVYDVTKQTTAAQGMVCCQLRLIDSDGNTISTPSFAIVVTDTVYNDEPITESSSEFLALTNLYTEVQQKLDNGEFKGEPFTYDDFTEEQLAALKGDKGDKGDTGPQGIQGECGVDGASVTIESISESTVDGGNNIIKFSNGKSITVKNGTKGSKGDMGQQGEQGDKGDKGDTGADGDSAYDIAVNNGFVGDEQAWLDSLKGEKGDKGETGSIINTEVEAKPNTVPIRDGSSAINVGLTFADVCGGLPIPMKKFDNGTSSNIIYWDGTKADKFYEDTDGASADNPIIINTAEELAYVVSAKYEDTYGKYFKIADSIDKIVLQSETYGKDIVALDSAEAVRDYVKGKASKLFPWVSNTWDETQMCFGGNFDGNCVEIYGMLSTGRAACGLFGLIDSAVISNVAVKNSYVNLDSSTENWQFGLIASYGKDCDTDKGDNVSYINHCIVANNYVYKYANNNGFNYSGVLLGGNTVGNYIIQNCLVYNNIATGYFTGDFLEYNLPIIGKTRNGLIAPDEFAIAHPDWVFNDGTNNLVKTVLEDSIILGTPPYADCNGVNNVTLRVLTCNEDINCLKNVYVDWDLDGVFRTAAEAVYGGTSFRFLPHYFLNYTGGGKVTTAQLIGDEAVINAPKLDWYANWFLSKSYSGKSIPLDFHLSDMGVLFKLIKNNTASINNNTAAINNNTDAINNNATNIDNNTTTINNNTTNINNNTTAINSKKITSNRVTTKYTLDWNAMYFITSNSGNADITLYNSSTDAVVVDGDDENLPAVSACLLILPKETIGTAGTYRTCILIGQTGGLSTTIKSRQFHVTSGNIYFTPPYAATVFKLAF